MFESPGGRTADVTEYASGKEFKRMLLDELLELSRCSPVSVRVLRNRLHILARLDRWLRLQGRGG